MIVQRGANNGFETAIDVAHQVKDCKQADWLTHFIKIMKFRPKSYGCDINCATTLKVFQHIIPKNQKT